jgi:hypothetical protein
MKEIQYARWRGYDPEDTLRFYALRLREAGMIKLTPNKLIAGARERAQARVEELITRFCSGRFRTKDRDCAALSWQNR